MNRDKQRCFVIMPFTPELHYFYLYLKQHIEKNHGILCERADEQVLTQPLLDKINNYIRNADVIIADCSGRNPNVFYELGIAHAHGKRVILITKDAVKEAPADIRHYEFIHYELDKHDEFLKKLDNALSNVFVERYENLFKRAKIVFNEFKNATNAQVKLASKEVFVKRVMHAERTQELPLLEDEWSVTEFVLPRIIAETNDVYLMKQIQNWLSNKWKQKKEDHK